MLKQTIKILTSPSTNNELSPEITTIQFTEDENYKRRSLNYREASPPSDQPYHPYLSETDLNSQKINQLNEQIEKAIDEIVELKNKVEDSKRRR